MVTKRENDDDIDGRLWRNQSSPRKLVTKFPVLIILDLNPESGQVAKFCDSPTIKANVKDDDMLNSPQRHEGM